MHMVLTDFDRETSVLIPESLRMLSPLELTQYTINDWRLTPYDTDDINQGIKMEITFKRKLTNELLTTYLPSFFLVGICYATTFFKQFYFEAAVTVNLTVMLVATTLFVRFDYDHII